MAVTTKGLVQLLLLLLVFTASCLAEVDDGHYADANAAQTYSVNEGYGSEEESYAAKEPYEEEPEGYAYASPPAYYGPSVDVTAVVKALEAVISGQVLLRGTPAYYALHPVHNGACRHIFPALIVRPESTEDVAHIVRVVRRFGMEMSVRGGGHSYQCQGIKPDSLQIDMRSINTVKLLNPYQAVLGAGNTWGDVLKVIDNKYYTLVHGQCLNVGVAGHLLGLGTNLPGISSRYGFGADNVIQHTTVLADGSIAYVNKYNTTIVGSNTYGAPTYAGNVIQHDESNDLRFALRSSGTSFGITTEFLYTVHPRPETYPMIIPVYLESSYDFKKIERAVSQGRFGFIIIESYFFRPISGGHIQAQVVNRLPAIMKAMAGRPIEPTFLGVMDLKANKRKGNLEAAINFLKLHGLQLAMDDPGLMRRFGLDAMDFSTPDQESVYLTEEERKREVFADIVSANHIGDFDTTSTHKVFFNHPIFGKQHKRSVEALKSGCDFCIWLLYFSNPYVPFDMVKGTPMRFVNELTCTFNGNSKRKKALCPKLVNSVKYEFVHEAHNLGQEPYQYVNTPSCDKFGRDFRQRYWGHNYEKLLRIKQYWDPDNFFRHCHSVGSTDNDCCVY